MSPILTEKLADMFRLLGDPKRLGVVLVCRNQPRAVSDIAEEAGVSLALASHHLRLLRSAGLANAERRGRRVFYQVADGHVAHMLSDMVTHVEECSPRTVRHSGRRSVLRGGTPSTIQKTKGVKIMETCKPHKDHAHKHGSSCGHTAIKHDGHVDYLHDGHLHNPHGDHVDEHVIAVSAKNPDICRPIAGEKHKHGPECGHEAIPHGDHVDYLVDGRLHHPHGDHCDDHGPVSVKK